MPGNGDDRKARRRQQRALFESMRRLPDHKLEAIFKNPIRVRDPADKSNTITLNEPERRAAILAWSARDPARRVNKPSFGTRLFRGVTRGVVNPALKSGAGFAAVAGVAGLTTGIPKPPVSTPPIVPKVPKMSLLSTITSISRSATPVLQALGTVTGSSRLSKAGNITAALGGQPIVLPGAGAQPAVLSMSALPRIGGQVLKSPTARGAAAGAALGFLPFGGDDKPKRRRMNPMNVKAARRAIRRIKAVRKITRDIERQLPVRTRTRTVPAGHKARLSHK